MLAHKKIMSDIKAEMEVAYKGLPMVDCYFGIRLDSLDKEDLLLVIRHLYFNMGGGHSPTKLQQKYLESWFLKPE